MWKTFIYEETNYILKVSLDKCYKIFLTNLLKFWVEELTKEQICQRCKELNPLIETDNETYLSIVTEALDVGNDRTRYEIKETEDKLVLNITSDRDELKFRFRVDFHTAGLEVFCAEYFIPLISTIRFMKNKEEKLTEVIERKDEEIKRHVFEKGDIEKKELITEKFDKNNFLPTPTYLCCDLFSNNKNYVSRDDSELIIKKEEKQPIEKKRKTLSTGQKYMRKKKSS